MTEATDFIRNLLPHIVPLKEQETQGKNNTANIFKISSASNSTNPLFTSTLTNIYSENNQSKDSNNNIKNNKY